MFVKNIKPVSKFAFLDEYVGKVIRLKANVRARDSNGEAGVLENGTVLKIVEWREERGRYPTAHIKCVSLRVSGSTNEEKYSFSLSGSSWAEACSVIKSTVSLESALTTDYDELQQKSRKRESSKLAAQFSLYLTIAFLVTAVLGKTMILRMDIFNESVEASIESSNIYLISGLVGGGVTAVVSITSFIIFLCMSKTIKELQKEIVNKLGYKIKI